MPTSKLQNMTGKRLHKFFSQYGLVENHRPDWLVSSKGERLELDFFIDKLSVAVEVQGQQHFEFTPHFHTTKYDFIEQVRRDEEKRELCNTLSIELLYVIHKKDIPNIIYDIQTKIDRRLIPDDWEQTVSKKLQGLISKTSPRHNTYTSRYDKLISKKLKASDDKQAFFDNLVSRLEQSINDTNGFEPSRNSKKGMRRTIKFCDLFIKDGICVSKRQQEILEKTRTILRRSTCQNLPLDH